MTTREIAELTEKNHSHVYRDAINMLEQLGYSNDQVDGCHQTWIHPQNKQHYHELCLTRDETLCLVAGYSPILRMKIITRLNELEAGNNIAIPQSFAEALRLAADQQETIQAQCALIENQRPAVQFVERYVQSNGNLGFRQVCKLLKAKENDFRAFLQDKQIMYRLAGEWVPYAPHIDAGRFCVTTGTGDNDHTYTSAKFTPKGVEWVSQLWSKK